MAQLPLNSRVCIRFLVCYRQRALTVAFLSHSGAGFLERAQNHVTTRKTC